MVVTMANTNLIHTHRPHTGSSSLMDCTAALPNDHPHVIDAIGRTEASPGARVSNMAAIQSTSVAATMRPKAYAHCWSAGAYGVHGFVMERLQYGSGCSGNT